MTCTIPPLKLNAVTSRLRFIVSLIPHPFWKVQYIKNVVYADKFQFTIRSTRFLQLLLDLIIYDPRVSPARIRKKGT